MRGSELHTQSELVWLVALHISHRNCAEALSEIAKRRASAGLIPMKPGASRIFGPELPKRYALSGTTGKAGAQLIDQGRRENARHASSTRVISEMYYERAGNHNSKFTV